jgi:uncharacterized membrane protein YfcA
VKLAVAFIVGAIAGTYFGAWLLAAWIPEGTSTEYTYTVSHN